MSTRKKNPSATRALILLHAGHEFCQFGFQAARVNAIVERAQITKGSLFHHFASKDELCQQWLKETLPPLLDTQWLAPLVHTPDPLATLKDIIREQVRVIETTAAREFYGNPLATLGSSIDPTDLTLKATMAEIIESWQQGISQALRDGQKNRKVHPAIQANDEATLIVALSIGIELQARAVGPTACAGFLRSSLAYLDTLRPV